MPELSSYDYAVIRVVPSLERGEFINAGIILHAKSRHFLEARTWLDVARLRVMAPSSDAATIGTHLESVVKIAAGGAGSGAIGELNQSQRFHWLVSPRSTMIQTSPVHSGLCEDPALELERLFGRLVRAGEETGSA